jgi:hypothetical protein
MRLREFASSISNAPESNLLTALELLRQRYKEKNTPAKISTRSLINLVLNTDRSFDYDALVAANEHNSAVKNLIKNINKDYVELKPDGDDSDDSDDDSEIDNTDQPIIDPADTVSDMAHRAAVTRGAPL